jgi:GT2 family glycosyltransferase
MLVRRDLIDRFGFFDPIYSPGYGEENDFCCRIARHGYTSVLANWAFVFHRGGVSFEETRRRELQRAHMSILRERYPEYEPRIDEYFRARV